MNMIQKAYDFLYPKEGFHKDLEAEATTRLFYFTVITVSTVFLMFSISYFIQGSYLIALTQFVISIVAALSWLLYRKTKSLVVAANFILIFGATSAFIRTKMMGGIESPAVTVWPIIPVYTVMLLPLRYAMFWSGVYLSYAFYFEFQRRTGVIYETSLSKDSLGNIRIIGIVIVQVLLFLIMYYYRRLYNKCREIIQKQKEDKANLLRVLTHDLASPLMVLKMTAPMLEQATPEKKAQYLNRINRAVNSLEGILSLVKELEAVGSGKKEMVLESVDLHDVMSEVKFLQHDNLSKKNLTLDISFAKVEKPYEVMADRVGLTYQVINNLISNGIKFSPAGSTINVDIDQIDSQVQIKIKDRGIGIPQELLKIIFDSGHHTTRKGTNGETGTGFGMPIVKSYIERFQGEIDIESITREMDAVNHGTLIIIKIPLRGDN